MLASSGSFSPELQIFTRGCTAAFKRSFVILLEDAWVPEAPLLALVGASYLSQLMPRWQPHKALLRATLDATIAACRSTQTCNWRKASVNRAACSLASVPVSPDAAANLKTAAVLLRLVRSFPGDMDMADTVAKEAKRGNLGMVRCQASAMPLVMPACHGVDHHTYRGVAHPMRGVGETFQTVFRRLFRSVTGVNPRWAPEFDVGRFEESADVKAARFGQGLVLGLSLPDWRSGMRRRLPLEGKCQLDISLDPGVLAAAVGPIHVSVKASGKRARSLIVTLGVREAEDEVVMIKPSRDTKAGIYTDLTPEEKCQAVAFARQKQHRLETPFPIGRVAEFRKPLNSPGEAEQWCVDGLGWAKIVEEGVVIAYDVHPTEEVPGWQGLEDDPHLAESAAVVGNGMRRGARETIRKLCEKVTI